MPPIKFKIDTNYLINLLSVKTITNTQKAIKKTTISLMSIVMVVSLNSCKEEATILNDNPISIEGYSISKARGNNYTLTYQTSQNVNTNTDKLADGVYNINLFFQENVPTTVHSETYPLENDILQINFAVPNTTTKLPVITIKDKKSEANATGRTGESTDFLNGYTTTNTSGNNYRLDFEVRKGIDVRLVYNPELDVHEVHLTPNGASTTATQHSANYTLTNGYMEIHFVNHKNTTARTEEEPERIPRIVVIGDEPIE